MINSTLFSSSVSGFAAIGPEASPQTRPSLARPSDADSSFAAVLDDGLRNLNDPLSLNSQENSVESAAGPPLIAAAAADVPAHFVVETVPNGRQSLGSIGPIDANESIAIGSTRTSETDSEGLDEIGIGLAPITTLETLIPSSVEGAIADGKIVRPEATTPVRLETVSRVRPESATALYAGITSREKGLHRPSSPELQGTGRELEPFDQKLNPTSERPVRSGERATPTVNPTLVDVVEPAETIVADGITPAAPDVKDARIGNTMQTEVAFANSGATSGPGKPQLVNRVRTPVETESLANRDAAGDSVELTASIPQPTGSSDSNFLGGRESNQSAGFSAKGEASKLTEASGQSIDDFLQANVDSKGDLDPPQLALQRAGSDLTLRQVSEPTANSNAATQDRAVVQQVPDAVVSHVRADDTTGKSTIQIELDPPELGRVIVDITRDRNEITVKLQTVSEASRLAVLSNLTQLRTSLGESGIELRDFDTSSREQSQNSQFQQRDFQERQPRSHHDQQTNSQSSNTRYRPHAPSPTTLPETRAAQVNIIV